MKVQLTWKPENSDAVIVEEVLVVSPDSTLYAFRPEGGIEDVDNNIELNSSSSIMQSLYDSGYVVFEDDEGLFGLKPEQIVDIKELE